MRDLRKRIAGPAARVGLTPGQYLACLTAGLAWCYRCKSWKLEDDVNGAGRCKPCEREDVRGRRNALRAA